MFVKVLRLYKTIGPGYIKNKYTYVYIIYIFFKHFMEWLISGGRLVADISRWVRTVTICESISVICKPVEHHPNTIDQTSTLIISKQIGMKNAGKNYSFIPSSLFIPALPTI